MAVIWLVLCSLVEVHQTTQYKNPEDSHPKNVYVFPGSKKGKEFIYKFGYCQPKNLLYVVQIIVCSVIILWKIFFNYILIQWHLTLQINMVKVFK